MLDNKENKVLNPSSMNNTALKARKIELEFEFEGYRKQIDGLLAKMQASRDEYKTVEAELIKRGVH